MACHLAPELATAWANRRTAAQALRNEEEAHRCRLRLVDLSRHASRPKQRREAQAELPTIMQTLATRRMAPLLLARLVRQDGLETVFLQNAHAAERAMNDCAPYQVLRMYYAHTGADPVRTHRVLGALAIALGDPFVAIDHFAQLDLPERDEVHAARRIATCYEDLFREDSEIDMIVRDGTEAADALEAPAPVTAWYDAGHLYTMAAPTRWKEARIAFDRAAQRQHDPSAYMRAWTVFHDPDQTVDAFADAAQAALDLDAHHRASGEAKDSADSETVEAVVQTIEEQILQAIQQAEIEEARQLVVQWAHEAGDDRLETSSGDRTLLSHDLLAAIRDAATKTGAIEKVSQALEKQRHMLAEGDLSNLRVRLDQYESVPAALLDASASRTARAETLGDRVQSDLSAEGQQMHREILTYLAMSRRITAQHALSLFAYLALAERHGTPSDVIEKTIDLGITDAVLSAGAVQDLQMAGVSLAAFAGPLQIGVAAAACCFAKTFIQSLTAPKLPAYADFHETFYSDLDGQADAVHEQVHTFLEGFLHSTLALCGVGECAKESFKKGRRYFQHPGRRP